MEFKGRCSGEKIVPVIGNSECGGDPAMKAVNKVIDQDGVHYIIGEVCSGASILISQVAEAKGVIEISPASTHDQVTLNADGSTKRFVFRACYTDSFQGFVAGKFAVDFLEGQARVHPL